jgi:hypothetical protein
MLTQQQDTSGLTVLTRLVQRKPERVEWLAQVLGANLDQLAELALAVAIEMGDPIGRVLADVLRQHPDVTLAARLVQQLPERTVALQELAFIVTAIYHAHLCELLAQHSNELRLDELADVSNDLANRLSATGRWEEALMAAEDTVRLSRMLAEARREVFRPTLARALTTLAAVHAMHSDSEARHALQRKRPSNSTAF